MELPKGSFKGLAKIIGPLLLWLTAGWAAYPYLIEKISTDMGEVIAIEEIQLLSYFMVAASSITGIILIIYGYTGSEVADSEINALNTTQWPCPHCLTPQAAYISECNNCGNYLER